MRDWTLPFAALTVWAAHFFALYIIASSFPGTGTARLLTLAATVPALVANGTILWFSWRSRSGGLSRWMRQLGALGAALSLVAVIWQALPALIV